MPLPGFEEHTELSPRARAFMEDFENVLRGYSIEKPALSKDLELQFNLKGSDIRQMVQYLRRGRRPIGSSSKGYFWATERSQLSETFQHLNNRKQSLETTLNRMKEIKFSGQANLF